MAALTVEDKDLDLAIRYMKLEDVVAADPAERETVKELYLASVLYIGVEKPSENPYLWRLAVHGLTLHYYDHRDSIGDPEAIPKGTRTVINRLKLAPVSKSDTGGEV